MGAVLPVQRAEAEFVPHCVLPPPLHPHLDRLLGGNWSPPPPAIVSYAFGRWMGGRDMCLFHGFVMILVQELTHLTVAGMAVERLLAICHGYLYERLVTHTRCWYLLASIWVFSLLLCLLPLFGLGELYLQYPFTWCYVNIHLCSNSPLRHRIFTTSLGVLNVGCIVTVVACNVCVVGSLLRMRLSRRVPAHLSSGRRPSVQRDQELQMVVLLVVITISFVVSWAPLNIILVGNLMWPPHVTREDHMRDLVAIRLASISQILDPWVYIICRVIFKSKLWRCWRRALVGRRWSRRRSSHSVKIKSIADESHSEPSCGPAPHPAPPRASLPAQEGVGGAPGLGDDTALGNGIPPLGPPWQGTHAHITPAGLNSSPHHPDALQNASTLVSGTGEGAPLARSVSLAIPIPLFICEHYSMAQQGAGHLAPCWPDPAMLSTGQQVLRARSCCLDHHLPLPAMPGVPRSYSWGCRAAGHTKPHHRSCSTQTLPGDAHTTQHAQTPTHAPAGITPPGE
ncbi:prostaglandin E2 receptor EP4 subtype-like [Scylla paramamosain]|uniref:prostaglandin E2 receptor EP4 subtype-like n=1 Tax=Scylla paramamosain TaxID=85552 RepID=UPI003083E08A